MAIAIELAIALATLLVEDEDLVALYDGAYYFTNYLCALYYGSADGYIAVVVDEENLVEFNSLARLGGLDVVDEELLALLSLELLTVNLYDCVHFCYYMYERVFPGGVRLLLLFFCPSGL